MCGVALSRGDSFAICLDTRNLTWLTIWGRRCLVKEVPDESRVEEAHFSEWISHYEILPSHTSTESRHTLHPLKVLWWAHGAHVCGAGKPARTALATPGVGHHAGPLGRD